MKMSLSLQEPLAAHLQISSRVPHPCVAPDLCASLEEPSDKRSRSWRPGHYIRAACWPGISPRPSNQRPKVHRNKSRDDKATGFQSQCGMRMALSGFSCFRVDFVCLIRVGGEEVLSDQTSLQWGYVSVCTLVFIMQCCVNTRYFF